MNHTIRRQLLELNLDGKQPPFDLQNRLSDDYYHTLLPILEKWFDDSSTEDETLYIDRLVIDLGAFRSRDFNDQELKDRLIARLQSIDITHTSPDIPTIRRSTRHNAYTQWLYYMEKGYLPWNLLRITKGWENKVLETLATDYKAIAQLKQILLTQTNTLIRITLQQDHAFLTRIVEILTAHSQNGLPQYLAELHQLLVHISKQEPLSIPSPIQIWQGILALAATGAGASPQTSSNATPLQLTRILLTHYWSNHSKPQPTLESYLVEHPLARIILTDHPSAPGLETRQTAPQKPTTPPINTPNTIVPTTSAPQDTSETPKETLVPRNTNPNKITEPPPQTQSAPIDTINKTTPSQEKPQTQQDPATTQTQIQQTPTKPPHAEKRPQPSPENDFETPTRFDPAQLPEEGLFLANAGVILTHPFLNTLFKATRLVISGKFIDTQTREKAIHLIHYLATGNTHAEEHELVMAKLICGAPIELPLSQEVPWQDEELQEANLLLEGLISYWGVKNITIEGLRGNFLTRNGKLSTKPEKLHLVLEKHAVDILVRTYPLPWNMSIIRLPWLKQTIHMDW